MESPVAIYMNPKILNSTKDTPWFMLYHTKPMIANTGIPDRNEALTRSSFHPLDSLDDVSMVKVQFRTLLKLSLR